MAGFNINVGFKFNKSQFDSAMAGIVNSVKSVPAVNIGSATGANMDTGNAQGILNSINEQATALDKVTIKSGDYRNALGEVIQVAESMTVVFKDMAGNAATATRSITSDLDLEALGFERIGKSAAVANIGIQDKKTISYYKTRLTQLQTISEKSTEWANRSQSMGEKERASIEGINAAIQKRVKWMTAAASRGDTALYDKHEKGLQKLNVQLEESIAKTKRSATGVKSWSTRMGDAVKQTIAYATSLGVLRMAQQALNEVLQFTIDINTEMVKIQLLQVEGAQSPEDIRELAVSYNTLAKELSATTQEIAEGSVEWLRQGKSVAETTDLLRASTMLSKLGNMEAAESTEYLTSALNGYNMASTEAIGIVDKLIAVDNVAATSAKELATALRYSSAVAAQAGIPLETLISYIGTLSSTTRQNAEMIGQALKTIFTRMQDIKQGGLDDDGLGINNVERALSRVGVQLRDSKTSFRDMDAVLQDLAVKWNTLNEVEQANIAKSIAGVRQQNMFLILMSEMNQALGYQEEQMNAVGLATERYGIYTESIVAKQTAFKATLEELFLSGKGFDGLIISVIDLSTKFVEFINAIGGLPPLLFDIGTIALILSAKNLLLAASAKLDTFAFSELGKQLITTKTIQSAYGDLTVITAIKVNGLTLAIKKLLFTNPVGWMLLLTGVMVTLGTTTLSTEEKLTKLNEQIAKTRTEISELRSQISTVAELGKRFTELKESIAAGGQVTQEYWDVQNKLKEMYPELNGYMDEYGNFIISDTESMQALTDATIAQIQAKRELLAIESGEALQVQAGSLETAYKTKEYAEKQPTSLLLTEENKQNIANDYKDALEKTKAIFLQAGQEDRNIFLSKLTDGTAVKQVFEDYNRLLKGQLATLASELADEEYRESLGITPTLDTGEFAIKLGELETSLEEFEAIKEKVAAGTFTLDADEVSLLTEAGIQYRETSNGIVLLSDAESKYNTYLRETITNTADLNPMQERNLDNFLKTRGAVEDLNATFMEHQSMLDDIAQSMYDTGEITYEQSEKMIAAGYGEAVMIDAKTGKITVNEYALRRMALAEADAAVTSANLAVVEARGNGQSDAIVAGFLRKAEAAQFYAEALGAASDKTYTFAPISMGGGSGGSSGEADAATKAKEAIQKKIDALEDEKDALNDRLDAYKDYIDAQKESLELEKEEADFAKDLLAKNQSLAKLRARIALLALDDSEEARAERLGLEEEAAELETEIQEDKEDRIYDLKMDAWDAALAAFQAGIELQIEGIEDKIDKYNDEKDAIESVSSATGGASAATIDYGVKHSEVYQTLLDEINDSNDLTELQKQRISEVISNMEKERVSIDNARKAWLEYLSVINNGGVRKPSEINRQGYTAHEGMLIPESHHDGDFAGGLRSNEVFAKLLKGEFVATEGQMYKFLNRTMPSMMNAGANISQSNNSPTVIDLDINVEGNLDENVVPTIEGVVLKQVNKALGQRGVRRTVGSFGI